MTACLCACLSYSYTNTPTPTQSQSQQPSSHSSGANFGYADGDRSDNSGGPIVDLLGDSSSAMGLASEKAAQLRKFMGVTGGEEESGPVGA